MDKIENIFRETADSLYRFCCNISDSLYDAEDLFQDTLLKAVENEEKFMKVENKKNYLLGIAMHLEKNNRRKKSRRGRIAPEARSLEKDKEIIASIKADEKSAEERLIQKEQLESIRNLIAKLNRSDRIIASMYYGENLTIREISKIVKLPEGTVKSRLYKIRKQLREGLEV